MKRLTLILVALSLLSYPVWANQSLSVGATPGPHHEILEFIQPLMKAQGIDLKIVVFTDYVTPNLALAQRETDANSFQHIPYLENFSAARGLKLTWIAPTVIFPMAAYSLRYDSLQALPDRASVAIPNDPTNGGRALLLLDDAGVITLKAGVGIAATVDDIVANPKRLRILELDAAQLPRSLQDVHAAVINTNFAIEAGLNPVTGSIYRESVQSPYVNVIAVRQGEENDPRFAKLIEVYQSAAVAKFIEERFQGSVVVGWE